MFSLKNKKQNRVVFALALFFFASGAFFLTPSTAHAFSWWELLTTNPVKTLLYAIFWVLGLVTSMAITLFEWAINPNYISGPDGLLNRASVYAMWKLIRDFFNLFFILTLLYTAFTIVFQVAKDYKKTLLSLVLAALFVNFSFPVTRLIIDATNVPMYYFVNQIGSTGSGQKDMLGTVLSASKIQGILIPGSEESGSVAGKALGDVGVSQLLMAIIFLFVFSVSLLVLAVLFVVRLAALIILLIFASVGFAASVIPGLGKYSSMWWEKLWQYALFGPAAMLMLYIATRFFAEIATDNTKAQFVQSSLSNVTPENAGFVSSMAMFTIPIIMLWMTIGLASSMSIMGATAVAGTGQRFLKWAGKTVTKTPAAWAFRKYEKKMTDEGPGGFRGGKYAKYTKWLAPRAVVHGFESWRKDAEEQDKAPVERAGGAVHDRFNRIVGQHSNQAYKVRQQQVNKKAKELLEISKNSDYMINELDHAKDDHDGEAIEAALVALALTNNLNDLMAASRGKSYGEDLDTHTYKDKDGNDKKAVVISSKNYATMIKSILRETGLKDNSREMAMERMAIGEVALNAGNGAVFGQAYFNNKTKDWEESDIVAQGTAVKNKFKNIEDQQRQRTLHPDTVFKYFYDDEGKRHIIDVNDEVGIGAFSAFTQGDVNNIQRARPDMKEGVYELDQMKTPPPEFARAIAANSQVMPDYIAGVRAAYTPDAKWANSKPKSGSNSQGPQPGDTVSKGGIHIPAGSKTA